MPVYEVHYREPGARIGWWPRVRIEMQPQEAIELLRPSMIELAWGMSRDVRLVERIVEGEGFGSPAFFADEPLLLITSEQARDAVIDQLDLDRPLLDDGAMQEIRRRAAFTPEGPWIRDHVNSLGKAYRTYAVPGVEWKDDATGGLQDFIAHSRMDLPLALLEIERLREKVRRLESGMEARPDPEDDAQGIVAPRP